MGNVIIDSKHITNRKFMSALYRSYSVDIGEPFRYCVPMSMCEMVFGLDAKNFLYEVGQGLNTNYTKFYNGELYVCVSGFEIMKSYRGAEIYRELHEQWLKEVKQNDSNERKPDKSKHISRKGKEV